MNEAVLQAVEQHALTPEAVESVIALTERDDRAEMETALRQERTDRDQRIARLVAAIEGGADVSSVKAKLRELEERTAAIGDELTDLQPVPRLPAVIVADRLNEWRRLLRSSTTQARAVLQRIIVGRPPLHPSCGYVVRNRKWLRLRGADAIRQAVRWRCRSPTPWSLPR